MAWTFFFGGSHVVFDTAEENGVAVEWHTAGALVLVGRLPGGADVVPYLTG
jgi:hypothetical protein